MPDLLPLSDDPNAGVRLEVAEAMVSLRHPSPQAIAALGRLAMDADDRVATVAREALETREANGQGEPPAVPQTPWGLLVPLDLWPEVPRLRTLLTTWRATLSSSSGECPTHAVAELDVSLTRLIQALDEARVPTPLDE